MSEQRLRKHVWCLILVCLLAPAHAMGQLPKQVQLDLIADEMYAQLENRNWSAALDKYDAYCAMEPNAPPDLSYVAAAAARELGDAKRTVNALERYFKVLGDQVQQHEKYSSALGLYAQAKSEVAAQEEAERKQAEVERKQAELRAVEALRQSLPQLESAKRAKAAELGERALLDCPECPLLVKVPAGSFTMGSPRREKDRQDNEGPQHKVKVREFAVGVYEVTFDEWDLCVAEGACTHRPEDEGWGRGQRPVINVSWHDAHEYITWINGKTGGGYRLPSEAEWEYATRAGSSTEYWWGDAIGNNRANCRGCGSRWDSRQTAPVGSFDANPFGLHDVHGNVLEWVADCYHSDYKGAPADGQPWIDSNSCSYRVQRGGSGRRPVVVAFRHLAAAACRRSAGSSSDFVWPGTYEPEYRCIPSISSLIPQR